MARPRGGVEEAARLVARAGCVLVLAGFGVGGCGPRVSLDGFLGDPLGAWRAFAGWLRGVRGARPGPAHYAVAALEAAGVVGGVVSLCPDGLLGAAGVRGVVELHGSAGDAVCVRCGRRVPVGEALREVEAGRVPRCPCGGLLKPGVVLYGEPVPEDALREAVGLARRCDLVLAAGPGLGDYPAAQLPLIVKERGGGLVVVAPGVTALDGLADLKVEAPVDEALPAICEGALGVLGRGGGCRGP